MSGSAASPSWGVSASVVQPVVIVSCTEEMSWRSASCAAHYCMCKAHSVDRHSIPSVQGLLADDCYICREHNDGSL